MRTIAKYLIAFAAGVAVAAGIAIADTTGPTEQSALAADQKFSNALAANDTATLRQLLASDWIVVSADGGYAPRDPILKAIDDGVWTHTSAVISNQRVKIYGDTALVTEHAVISGASGGKPYTNIAECQTDVLVWQEGAWHSELLHESFSKDANTNC